MAGFDIQQSIDDDTDFTPISEGWHMAQVNRAILGESKPPKSVPQIQVQFKILSPHGDKGKTSRSYINLEDGSWGYTQLAKLCRGIDPNMQGDAQTSAGFDPHNQQSVFQFILGGILNIKILHTEGLDNKGNERTYANVDAYGYANPEQRQCVFAEIGGEPELDDDCYCDYDGLPLNGAAKAGAKGQKEDPWANDSYADKEIPF